MSFRERWRERISIDSELSPAFSVLESGACSNPFVFNSPHSGKVYSKHFLSQSRLDATALRKSEDAFVDALFEPAVPLGAPLLRAHFPRAYLDVNREPYELDPQLFDCPVPAYANISSLRVAGGLGTIARVVAEREEIYHTTLPLDAALERIHRIYMPYHERLKGLLDAAQARFGAAVLIDCHSMPSQQQGDQDEVRPDVVLGDRFGTSCDREITIFVQEQFRSMGYNVALNKPYAGGFITEHYGEPKRNRHALQIELNRALYMDEATFARSPGFDCVVADIERMCAAMFTFVAGTLSTPPLAAE